MSPNAINKAAKGIKIMVIAIKDPMSTKKWPTRSPRLPMKKLGFLPNMPSTRYSRGNPYMIGMVKALKIPDSIIRIKPIGARITVNMRDRPILKDREKSTFKIGATV